MLNHGINTKNISTEWQIRNEVLENDQKNEIDNILGKVMVRSIYSRYLDGYYYSYLKKILFKLDNSRNAVKNNSYNDITEYLYDQFEDITEIDNDKQELGGLGLGNNVGRNVDSGQFGRLITLVRRKTIHILANWPKDKLNFGQIVPNFGKVYKGLVGKCWKGRILVYFLNSLALVFVKEGSTEYYRAPKELVLILLESLPIVNKNPTDSFLISKFSIYLPIVYLFIADSL
uniref:Uncharacterized protein n=1 Tax=Rhizophagus irregularis (strain DAOM 181602 / DAOM 197198 / MUCL 43194) TaxID=747089 RepID=U9UMK6_RHIID